MDELKGTATPEQIAAWKQKYGEVNQISIDHHVCYLKRPDRATLSYALSQMKFGMGGDDGTSVEMDMGRMYKTGEAVMTNCWIGGSEEIKSDDSLWMNACTKASELIEFKEASLKKL